MAHEDFPLLEPEIRDYGIAVEHNMPCCVYHSAPDAETAVMDTNRGVFEPSWAAQKRGWHLIQATTGFQRWVARIVFDVGS